MMYSLPQVGEWYLLLYAEPLAPGCPYRAVPAEVMNVNGGGSDLSMTMQADASMMWLHDSGMTEACIAQATVLLRTPRRVGWKEYEDYIEGLFEHEVCGGLMRVPVRQLTHWAGLNRWFRCVGRRTCSTEARRASSRVYRPRVAEGF